jgi:DNA end-binding protein Ku
MAPRAVWKGFLKLASVSCAVKLEGATTENDKVHFRTLNRKTRTPVHSIYIDEGTGKPVDTEDQVKGYQLDNEEFVIVEPEEIKRLKVQSQQTLEIDHFINPDAVPSPYREKPYYLYPADKVAVEPFAVMREAMVRKKMAGIACIVLYQRERPVIIEPMGKGLLMTTLRYQNWVVEAKEVFSGLHNVKVDPEMTEIASLIIEKKVGKFEPKEFEDTYEDALLEVIKAKQEGKEPPKPVQPPHENVINLADVLRKSLVEEGGKPSGAKGRKTRTKADGGKKRKSAA